MSKKQSAVEHLIDQILLDLYFDQKISPDRRDRILAAIHKSRQLFKEQIEHAATYGANSPSPEAYYNKTFKP